MSDKSSFLGKIIQNTTKSAKLGVIFDMIERLHILSDDLINPTKFKRQIPPIQRTGSLKPTCKWGNWSEWTPCSVSCGSGEEARWRQQRGQIIPEIVEEEGQFQIELRHCHLDDCNPWGDIMKSIGFH